MQLRGPGSALGQCGPPSWIQRLQSSAATQNPTGREFRSRTVLLYLLLSLGRREFLLSHKQPLPLFPPRSPLASAPQMFCCSCPSLPQDSEDMTWAHFVGPRMVVSIAIITWQGKHSQLTPWEVSKKVAASLCHVKMCFLLPPKFRMTEEAWSQK